MQNKSIGVTLAKQSWNVLKVQKSLFTFMATSTIFSLTILFVFLHFLTKLEALIFVQNEPVTLMISAAFLVGVGLFFMFINVTSLIFSAGLIKCAVNFFQEKSYSLSAGFKVMISHFFHIYAWELAGNFLGGCLKFLSYWVDHWNQSTFAQKMLAGLPWGVATYFGLPLIINENNSATQAIRHSAQLIYKTWGIEGKSLRLEINLSVKITLLKVFLLLPLFSMLFISHGTQNTLLVGATIISMILLIVFNTITLSCQVLTLSALYLFSKGVDLSNHYDHALLKSAFRPVERKAWE